MISLRGSGRTYVSPKLFQPTLHTGTDFTVHTVTHNLGIKPDTVSVLWDDGRIIYDLIIAGNYTGYVVNNTTETIVEIYMFRYAIGYFYVMVANLSGNNFPF